MADGQKTKLQYIFGLCAECKYTTEQLVEDYPVGTGPSAVESTGTIVHGVGRIYMVVFPHRPTCSLHTKQKEYTA